MGVVRHWKKTFHIVQKIDQGFCVIKVIGKLVVTMTA
jgi:hypothetical protein